MEEKSFIHVLPILWNSKYLIGGCVLATAILMSIAVLLKPNYYQSETTFYPVNSALLDPSVEARQNTTNYYGDDRDVDRLLSIGHSNDISQAIIKEYTLDQHYNIDTSTNSGKTRLLKRFNKLYSIQKTEFDAIQIAMEDKDPTIARDLTVAIRQSINKKAIDIIHESQNRLLKTLKSSQSINAEALKTISDSLTLLRSKFGIYDTKTQAEAMVTLEIKSPRDNQLKSKINDYQSGISAVTNLELLERKINENLTSDALKIRQIESSLSTDTPAIHLIEEAIIPIEKSRPHRSLYALASMLLAFILATALIIIRDQLSTKTE